MSDTSPKRKTQAQRRAQSSQAVLESAIRLFGRKGYDNTSLEDIAADCGLTIRPIYHYFGNKKALFCAVNEQMEQRIVDTMNVGEDGQSGAGVRANWGAYLDLCEDPEFRQIVLVDSPNILGRKRWSTSPVTRKASESLASLGESNSGSQYRVALVNRILMAAFTEAALLVAESDDIAAARKEAEALMVEFVDKLKTVQD